MTFRKQIGKLHLWLGLASGLLVCFLGITGCILVFEQEIETVTAPYQIVTPQEQGYLPPIRLKAVADQSFGGGRKTITLEYGDRNQAAKAYYYQGEEYLLVFLNPYTGEVLKRKDMQRDFFRFVISGHYNLWLPHEIGQPIVASATLIFVVMMISGMILWWPRNKAARKQRFSVKWTAQWRRVNYDLHNVLGFYMMGIGVLLALTGLIMGFQWVAKSVYWVSSGGKSIPVYVPATSDTVAARKALPQNTTDLVWQQWLPLRKAHESLSVAFPTSTAAAIELRINHRPGTYYDQDVYHFDQYSGKPVTAQGFFSGLYARASMAEKVNRMNYDLHVGSIGGLFTKLLAFCASLVVSSLPITGFILWRGRKKKQKRKPVQALQMA